MWHICSTWGSLTTAQALHSPLHTPKWMHTAPKDRICWGFIKKNLSTPSGAVYAKCHMQEGKLWWLFGTALQSQAEGALSDSSASPSTWLQHEQQHSRAAHISWCHSNQWPSHFCGLALLLTVRGCGGCTDFISSPSCGMWEVHTVHTCPLQICGHAGLTEDSNLSPSLFCGSFHANLSTLSFLILHQCCTPS